MNEFWNASNDDDRDDDWDDESDEFSDEEESTLPCPACGSEIHEESVRCPYCGDYVDWSRRATSRAVWVTITAIVLIFALLVPFLFKAYQLLAN